MSPTFSCSTRPPLRSHGGRLGIRPGCSARSRPASPRDTGSDWPMSMRCGWRWWSRYFRSAAPSRKSSGDAVNGGGAISNDEQVRRAEFWHGQDRFTGQLVNYILAARTKRLTNWPVLPLFLRSLRSLDVRDFRRALLHGCGENVVDLGPGGTNLRREFLA